MKVISWHCGSLGVPTPLRWDRRHPQLDGTPSWMAPPDGWHPQGSAPTKHPKSAPKRPPKPKLFPTTTFGSGQGTSALVPGVPTSLLPPPARCPRGLLLGFVLPFLVHPQKKLKANPPPRKPHTFLGLFTFSPGCTCPILPSTHWAPKNSQWDSRARFALSHTETNVEEERPGRRGAAGVT